MRRLIYVALAVALMFVIFYGKRMSDLGIKYSNEGINMVPANDPSGVVVDYDGTRYMHITFSHVGIASW